MEVFYNFMKLTNIFYLWNKNDRFKGTIPQYILMNSLFFLFNPQ